MKPHVSNKLFENISYNDISEIVIPELLTNIFFCRRFVNYTKLYFILSCRSKLVGCYVSKYFVILENTPSALSNLPLRMK